MIPCSAPRLQTRWQNELANAITDPRILLEYLELPTSLLQGANLASEHFSMRVPWSFVYRMQKGCPDDPLLLQVLPVHDETIEDTDSSLDPVGDIDSSVCDGVLHKYQGRVLLITTAACAVHCRYCFRRHFPYQQQHAGGGQWQQSLEYIRNDSSIEEVILSGGDPLSLSDARLQSLTASIDEISHVKRLRIHTRFPIMLPSRITSAMLDWINALRMEVIFVVHCNHAAEINDEVSAAISKLRSTSALLLNQAVLLGGINDTIEAQYALQSRLIRTGILPYYLHMLDRVQGAVHFDVNRDKAHALLQAMREQLPGYMVPRMVEEVSGQPHKLPL